MKALAAVLGCLFLLGGLALLLVLRPADTCSPTLIVALVGCAGPLGVLVVALCFRSRAPEPDVIDRNAGAKVLRLHREDEA